MQKSFAFHVFSLILGNIPLKKKKEKGYEVTLKIFMSSHHLSISCLLSVPMFWSFLCVLIFYSAIEQGQWLSNYLYFAVFFYICVFSQK